MTQTSYNQNNPHGFAQTTRTNPDPAMSRNASTAQMSRVKGGSMYSKLAIKRSIPNFRQIKSSCKSIQPLMLQNQYSHPNQFPIRKLNFHHTNSQRSQPKIQHRQSEGQLKLKIIRTILEQDQPRTKPTQHPPKHRNCHKYTPNKDKARGTINKLWLEGRGGR